MRDTIPEGSHNPRIKKRRSVLYGTSVVCGVVEVVAGLLALVFTQFVKSESEQENGAENDGEHGFSFLVVGLRFKVEGLWFKFA
jgi:hypothetical protein